MGQSLHSATNILETPAAHPANFQFGQIGENSIPVRPHRMRILFIVVLDDEVGDTREGGGIKRTEKPIDKNQFHFAERRELIGGEWGEENQGRMNDPLVTVKFEKLESPEWWDGEAGGVLFRVPFPVLNCQRFQRVRIPGQEEVKREKEVGPPSLRVGDGELEDAETEGTETETGKRLHLTRTNEIQIQGDRRDGGNEGGDSV